MFNDVEKLKTTIKELVNFSAKQAEVTEAVCKKVLSEKDSNELRNDLGYKLPKYDVPSPTPSLLQGHTPLQEPQHHHDNDMDIDGNIYEAPVPKENKTLNSDEWQREKLHPRTKPRLNDQGRTQMSNTRESEDHFDYT